MAPDMVAATLALQHAPLATILDYYVYFPALIEPLWNHQAIMLGAWPLLLESGQASQSALRLHAHFPDGFAARDWLEQNRDKILERAIQTLDNLDYIGICEDFDNSVRELFESLRLPLSDVVPHFNQRERYPDEADPELWTRAKPLTELDAEIYAEACRRHGSHRNRRVNRADFLKRTVAAGEDQIFDANAQPGGHGWHYPQLRLAKSVDWARFPIVCLFRYCRCWKILFSVVCVWSGVAGIASCHDDLDK